MFTQDVGSIYVEWGSYNICTCPPVCVLTIICSGRGRDLAGVWSSDEQQRIWVAVLYESSSVLSRDMGRHPAPAGS